MNTPLRPMNLGELLDRSFYLYRKHFILFAGIIALPYMVLLAFQLLGVVVAPQTAAGGMTGMSLLWLLLTMGLSLVAVATSHGATVVAVSKIHLGGSTSISEALSGIQARIPGLSWIVLGLGVGVIVGFICLIIPGILLALMWAVTIPVAVVEGRGLLHSVQRSTDLTKGSWGRIFVVYFLFGALFYIVYLLFNIPIFYAIGISAQRHGPGVLPGWSQAAFPIGAFLTQTLVGPLMTIGTTLIYYDQRVRNEAFDLQHLMANLDSAQGDAPTPAPV
jgi:hypothetical protein